VRADGQKPNRRRERWASGPGFAKPISIKGAKRRFGGDARKAVELTSGDLSSVTESGLRVGQLILIRRQKSAEGILPTSVVGKAQTVIVNSRTRFSWAVMRQPIRFGGACQGRIG